MKRVVSISLGSSKRDKKVHARLFGEDFEIERIGTDGDPVKYRKLISDLDGKVDAFGIGGTDIYLYADKRRYTWREPLSFVSGAKITPYVDGSGLKHTLERESISWLQDHGVVDFSDKTALLVSAVDRFGMADGLNRHCKQVIYGDLLYGVGVPIAIRSWSTFKLLASIILPVITRLPFRWFYPTGEKQDVNTPKFPRYFHEADIVAGDFPIIRRYMPEDMKGKIVLTNTTTESDVEELARRGVSTLITTTPVFDGRSFGTNVMEGVLITLMGKRPEELKPEDYLAKLKELGWTPQVRELNVVVVGTPAPARA